MANLTTRLMTMLRGTLVGRDDEGNSYYRAASAVSGRPERRWVLYKGEVEASRIPPHWHAWLHRLVDTPPDGAPAAQSWQKPHQANMTGSPDAYRPAGSVLRGAKRAASTSDYEPWTPN